MQDQGYETEKSSKESKKFPLSKSVSGGNLNHTSNGNKEGTQEQHSTSSASGVSSPSNNSQQDEDEK